MRLPPRFALGCGALAAVAAFALPLAAQMGPFASAGPEVVIAPPAPTPSPFGFAAIGTDGTNFALFSEVMTTWEAQRVSPTGALLDPTQVTLPYSAYGLAVAPSAAGYLLVWYDGARLVSAHLDSNLAAVDATPTTLTNGGATSLAIARAAGGGYLVTWFATGFPAGSIQALLLDSSGAPAGSAFTVGPGGQVTQATYGPAVVYGGGNYEIVWGDAGDLFAVHVSEAGTLLDAPPITISTNFYYGAPVLVAGATEDIVAWLDAPSDGGAEQIYAARIGFDGTLLDPGGMALVPGTAVRGLAYSTSTGVVMSWVPSGTSVPSLGLVSESNLTLTRAPGTSLTAVSLASNGSVSLAAWSGAGGQTQASPLSAQGAPALSPPDTLGLVAGRNEAAVVASSGNGYATAWMTTGVTLNDGVSGGPAYSLWFRALAADGTPLGQPLLLEENQPGGTDPAQPFVVWTGQQYVVLWFNPAFGFYYVRFAPSGAALDSSPQLLGGLNAGPAVYTGGNDELFAVTTGSAVTITAIGTNVDGGLAASAGSGAQLSIGYTSTQAALAWLDATHFELVFTGPAALYGCVVNVTTMTATPPVIIDSTAGLTQPLVALGQYETAVAVIPPQGGSMLVYRLDPHTGAVLDGPSATQSVAGATGASLTWDGARYVLAWGSPGDAGTIGYASDLGTAASRFAIAGALQPFSESIAAPGPAIARMGDGGALLVATRALASDTSVVDVTWTSAPPLPPPPPPPSDAGIDAGIDAGPPTSLTDAGGNDAGGDAGRDDAGSDKDAGIDDGAADASSDAAIDSAAPTVGDDAGPPGDAGEGADGGMGESSGASGCSCHAGAQPASGGPGWAGLVAMSFAGLRFARRSKKRAIEDSNL